MTDLRQFLADQQLKPICINALADITFHKGQARVTVEELCHFLCYAGQILGCRDLEVTRRTRQQDPAGPGRAGLGRTCRRKICVETRRKDRIVI